VREEPPEVDEAVHDRAIEEALQPGEKACDVAARVHQHVDEVDVEEPQRARQEQRAPHRSRGVRLVEVVLVRDQRVERAHALGDLLR
jgi:hypothetical protein